LVMAAAGVLLAGAAAAQELPDTLTLDAALNLAADYNPALRRAVVQADASHADVRAGFGAFLPTLNANLGFSGSRRTQATGEDDAGRPVDFPEPLTFRTSNSTQSLSGSWTLFNGFENINNYKASRAGADATAAGVDVSGTAVAAEVTRRFFDALQARSLIEVEEALLDVSRRQLDATQRLFRVAARTEVDVLGAQVQLAQQEQALARALGDAVKTRVSLAEQIGIDDWSAFQVEGELPAEIDPSGFDVDSLVRVAMRNNPRIAQRRAEAEQADYMATATKGRRWPVLSANASIGRNEGRQSYAALGDFNPQNTQLGFGVTLRWPLFTGFQTSQAVTQASANAQVAYETLREETLRLEREVRNAFTDLVTAYRRLLLAERSVELSRRRLAMAQDQYELGTIGFTDFQQIVTQSSQEARAWLQAQLEYARAGVTLQELLGQVARPW
jgi:outer membrane protein